MKKKITAPVHLLRYFLLFAVIWGIFVSVPAYAETSLVTASFTNNSGTSTAYSNLNRTVVKGAIITIPQVPSISGYKNLGWTTTKGKLTAEYVPGMKVRLNGNVTFYVVRERIVNCKVFFNNQYGTSTSAAYTQYNRVVTKGTVITLPVMPDITGYTTVGWTTKKGETSPIYACGSKVRIDGNVCFYLVRKKNVYYDVNFYYTTGSTNAAFQALHKKVLAGQKLTLPANPTKTGFAGMGWSTVRNSSTASYNVSSSVTVNGNMNLYAVYKQGTYVAYYSADGKKVLKTVSVPLGGYFSTVGMQNPAGKTMLGWSRRPNQVNYPDYLVGERIMVNGPMKLYPVFFVNSLERDYSLENMIRLDSNKYSKLIFVGDSRTSRMSKTIFNQFGTDVLGNIAYVTLDGSGYNWLIEEGERQLMNEIGDGGTAEKPIAIVFNHGINDITNYANYAAYYNRIAKILEKYHCKLFFESVNPNNNAVRIAQGHKSITENSVRIFNDYMKKTICNGGPYTYIDLYYPLLRLGFSYDKGHGFDLHIDDGLHYSTRTYKRIFSTCVKAVNAS